jgi:transcription initiation factor TFIID subunit TAF12
MGRRKEGPPSTLRRGHGPKEAHDSGLKEYVQDRAVSSMKKDIDEQRALREVNELAHAHPEMKAKFAEIVRAVGNNKRSCNTVLSLMRRELKPILWRRRFSK